MKIANALVKAMGEEAGGLNVVCNQGELSLQYFMSSLN